MCIYVRSYIYMYAHRLPKCQLICFTFFPTWFALCRFAIYFPHHFCIHIRSLPSASETVKITLSRCWVTVLDFTRLASGSHNNKCCHFLLRPLLLNKSVTNCRRKLKSSRKKRHFELVLICSYLKRNKTCFNLPLMQWFSLSTSALHFTRKIFAALLFFLFLLHIYF